MSIDGIVRYDCGTDIYILGFIKSDEWKDEVVKSVLDGYLISILNKDIRVKVEDVIIDDEHLPELMEQYKTEIPLTYNYYQVYLTEDELKNKIINHYNDNKISG